MEIGKDISGDRVISRLKEEHIDTSFLVVDQNDTTDFTTIIYSPQQGSVLLISRGKGRLEADNIPWDSLQANWFYVTSVEGNLNILEKLENTFISGTQKSEIAWNPGKREFADTAGLLKLLPQIELLILNRNEASLLTAVPWDDIGLLLKKTAELPSKTKLITDGQRGAYYFDGTDWWHADAYHMENPEVTGAGDAFGSAFVTGLIHGYSIQQCLHFAAANAASVVTYPGAKKGILTKEQNVEWLKRIIEIRKL